MDTLLDRVINQLNTLISFLAISKEDVFNLIQKEKKVWFSSENSLSLPKAYNIYKIQIIHSAFILGYSYFEAFLADLVKKIYLSRPKMLPKDKQLKYAEVLKNNNFNAVLELMIEKEIIDLFYSRIEDVIKYFNEKLNLDWPENYKVTTIKTSYLRNCIIHNKSLADHRLSEVSSYNAGDPIELNSSEVNTFGIIARNLVRNLYKQANNKHFNKEHGEKEMGKRQSYHVTTHPKG